MAEITEVEQPQAYLLAANTILKIYCCIEVALNVGILYTHSVSPQASSIIFDLSTYILMRL
jgi:hypothetical protein